MSKTASVSSDAASKALALLLEDFRLREQSHIGDTQTMKELESTRESLEIKVKELEIVLSGFTHHVRHAIAGVRRQENTLALIHRLPIEILQYIFLICASETFLSQMNESLVHNENTGHHLRNNDDSEEDCDEEGNSSKGPDIHDLNYAIALRLSKVCSHWNKLAVAQPRIWSYLDTRFNRGTTKLYLERSKRTPLFITCSRRVAFYQESEFIKLVMPHTDRWKAFNSYSKSYHLLMDLPEEYRSFPCLESFVIHSTEGAMIEIPYQIFESATSLREFNVSLLSFPFQMGSEVLSGLTSFGIQNTFEDGVFTMEDYELLFTSCPRLQTIFITGTDDSDCPEDLSTFAAMVPNLRSICFYGLDSRLVTTLLFSLFPNPAKPPIVKVIGSCDPDVSKQAFMDTTRVGSCMDLAYRNMAGLSTSFSEEVPNRGIIQIWGESEGNRFTFLEVQTKISTCLGKIAVSHFPPNGSSVLRELSLTTADDVIGHLAPSLNRCPHLEHLTITIIRLGFWQRNFVDLITQLAFPDGDTGPTASGPQLKYLLLNGVGTYALACLTDLVNARNNSTESLLLDSILLHRLEKLAVRLSKYVSETHPPKDTTSREMERLLAPRRIAFEFVDR
ncbi:hypothetical protein FRC02_003614 [Tulasnella sp. 418]|nr:hypothetical protein FRC02_003614 [Tulasnella sp. 418]